MLWRLDKDGNPERLPVRISKSSPWGAIVVYQSGSELIMEASDMLGMATMWTGFLKGYMPQLRKNLGIAESESSSQKHKAKVAEPDDELTKAMFQYIQPDIIKPEEELEAKTKIKPKGGDGGNQ